MLFTAEKTLFGLLLLGLLGWSSLVQCRGSRLVDRPVVAVGRSSAAQGGMDSRDRCGLVGSIKRGDLSLTLLIST